MRRSLDLSEELAAIDTLVELTSAFEGIASLRIAQIREQVLHSQAFFADLWKIYSQLRVDELFHFGRRNPDVQIIDKKLLILMTSEGSLSGDIDRRLVDEVLREYKPQEQAIVVVGHHGAALLRERGAQLEYVFKAPERDINVNAAPLISIVKKYRTTTVYYEQYQSLMSQAIKQVTLSNAILDRGSQVDKSGDIINEKNYIFEPSTYAVVNHLEGSMMQITLGEALLESKLAQYASRFKAMSTAHDRAADTQSDTASSLSRARRQEKDERLKEIVNGLRKVGI